MCPSLHTLTHSHVSILYYAKIKVEIEGTPKIYGKAPEGEGELWIRFFPDPLEGTDSDLTHRTVMWQMGIVLVSHLWLWWADKLLWWLIVILSSKQGMGGS